ncbi:hypothetical protein BX600DRAFT_511795 [Xylariales sp. PMI_506]|nr:hypothetical protein BX600DRAFT_511795 [Xylariales sp. PMI_506]
MENGGAPARDPSHPVVKKRASPLIRRGTYKFINEKLKGDQYILGDAYNDKKLAESREDWAITESKPYLRYVKLLSKAWPHLRLLADFMEVGTTPLRWDPSYPGGYKGNKKLEQTKRAGRTNVCLLQYTSTEVLAPIRYKTSKKLETGLATDTTAGKQVKLKLYVVEDLSRDVIELLGSHFKIEPDCFRAHILDYAWYNIRDYWRDPSGLDLVARRQRWFQLRFVRARYFETGQVFTEGFEEAQDFNVFRRPDDDNNKAFFDNKDSKVALMRSKATFWTNPGSGSEPTIAVLFLDPTIRKGSSLWRGYRNWAQMPEMSELNLQQVATNGAAPGGGAPATVTTPVSPTPNVRPVSSGGAPIPSGTDAQDHAPDAGDDLVPPGPTQKSFFEDFIFWAQRPDAFLGEEDAWAAAVSDGGAAAADDSDHDPSLIHVPAKAMLHLICAEWLTISDYVKTRLNQIEWEVAHPNDFLRAPIDRTLSKLHAWRRFVPLYREMVSETLLRVFRIQPTNSSSAMQHNNTKQSKCPVHARHRPTASSSSSRPLRGEGLEQRHGSGATADTTGSEHGFHRNLGVNEYRQDFELVQSYMEEFQQRIDRLTHVATAAINIEDSRRGISDNNNLQRLTYLATFFIPMSFVAALMSMQPDVTQLGDTAKIWAEVSLPSGVVIMAVIFVVSVPWFTAFLRRFPWFGTWRPFKLRSSDS